MNKTWFLLCGGSYQLSIVSHWHIGHVPRLVSIELENQFTLCHCCSKYNWSSNFPKTFCCKLCSSLTTSHNNPHCHFIFVYSGCVYINLLQDALLHVHLSNSIIQIKLPKLFFIGKKKSKLCIQFFNLMKWKVRLLSIKGHRENMPTSPPVCNN